MNTLTKDDYQHALNIKALLKEKFNDLIEQIYCYGSRVTKQTQDTDFDLLIITSKKIDWHIEDDMSSIIFLYGIDNDILFDTKYFFKDEFERNTYIPFIKEVKSYGVVI